MLTQNQANLISAIQTKQALAECIAISTTEDADLALEQIGLYFHKMGMEDFLMLDLEEQLLTMTFFHPTANVRCTQLILATSIHPTSKKVTLRLQYLFNGTREYSCCYVSPATIINQMMIFIEQSVKAGRTSPRPAGK